MNIKVIATDLDGTLLHNRLTISRKNLNALKKFILAGGTVCFLTGRCFISAKKFVDMVEKKTGQKIHYLSCSKGSILFDNFKNEFIYEQPMSAQVVTRILEIVKKHNCVFGAYLTRDLYTQNMWVYGNNALINTVNKTNIFPHYFIIKEWNNIDQAYKINISGVKFWGSNPKNWHSNFAACYDELIAELGDQIDISKTVKSMYEISSKTSNKGYAMECISKLLHVNKEEIACFGDSHNDLAMFEKSGLPIAIGDRSEELVAAAKHVIKGSKKNAVAKGIYKYIFK